MGQARPELHYIPPGKMLHCGKLVDNSNFVFYPAGCQGYPEDGFGLALGVILWKPRPLLGCYQCSVATSSHVTSSQDGPRAIHAQVSRTGVLLHLAKTLENLDPKRVMQPTPGTVHFCASAPATRWSAYSLSSLGPTRGMHIGCRKFNPTLAVH